jgi:hypothetical protein
VNRGPKHNLSLSITAIAFCADHFEVDSFNCLNLSDFPTSKEQENLSKIQATLTKRKADMGPGSESFGILLIDGLSVKEEQYCGFVGNFLGDIPLVGGSAGDDLKFEETFVYIDGEFRTNAATLTFVTTTVPFQIFKNQHFKETDQKIVITESNADKRVVNEIEGEPAAQAYAKKLGINVDEFSPQIFSKYTLMLPIGDENYVRSVQKVNEDGSLTFFCAIDNGLVLTMADKEDLLDSNNELFDQLENSLVDIDACLIFECILRRLEFDDFDKEQKESINVQYKKYNCIGFHTYGEQYGNVHINQTITGVAFGKKR